MPAQFRVQALLSNGADPNLRDGAVGWKQPERPGPCRGLSRYYDVYDHIVHKPEIGHTSDVVQE
jgi:hypothetical protein